MERYKKYIILLLISVSLVSIIRTIILLWNTFLPDFSIYYYSSQTLVSGDNPYLRTDIFAQATTLPLLLLVFSPLTYFGLSWASNIWLLLSASSALLTLGILYKTMPLSTMKFTLILTLFFVSFPFKFALGMGQINLLLLLTISLVLYFLKRKSIYSSIFLAVATIIKIYPLGLLIPIIINKKWQIILLTISLLGLFTLIGIVLIDRETNSYYLSNVLMPILNGSKGEVYYNQSFDAFAVRNNISSPISIFVRILIGAITVLMILKWKVQPIASVPLFLLTILIIGSVTWQHYFVVLLIPYFFLIACIPTVGKRYMIGLVISYLLIASNIKSPESLSDIWYGRIILSHGFFGMFLLWLIFITNKKIYEE